MKTQVHSFQSNHPTRMGDRKPITDLRLPCKELFQLENIRRGAKISVVSGTAWVTQSDDAQDYFVNAGETLEVSHSGKVVAQGWPEARLRVSSY